MIEHTYRVLEFNRLLNILSGYAACPLGKSDCLSLEPSDDLELIDNEHRLVSEMKLLLQLKGFFPLEGLTDIGPVLRNCRAEGSCLEPEELLFVFRMAEASGESKKRILSDPSLFSRLKDLTKEMPLFEGLRQEIKRAISPNGTINDSASPELKRLRRQKTLLRRDLQKVLENIKKSKGLTSDGDNHIVSIRDGRYVIPLRTDLKNRVDGIIHDYSQTQATCFVEPIEAIQDNNRLAELGHLEKEEELRIRRSITAKVRDLAEDLKAAQRLLGKLDGLHARAELSRVTGAVSPVLRHGNDVTLRQARNPILVSLASGKDSPVPSDILLDKDQNVMIISGPNRGGKTVTLKTLGLLSLMAQAGLHIPAAEGSSLPVFKNIMAEIGDDQDIQAGLSTFSAHIGHLKHMMAHADEKSLVIIDEPGMGTDPDEGAALAMAVLDELSQKGAFVAVSTHLNRLKTYGLFHERAKNARMEFDTSTNRPNFSLQYGMPGTSYAFEIANDAGVGPNILEQAKGYLDRDEVRLNRLIDKLNRLKQETTLEKLEAEQAKDKYRAAREKELQTLKKLDAEMRTLLEEKRSEADKLIQEAREQFKQLINTFKRTGESSKAHIIQHFDSISKDLVNRLSMEGKQEKTVDLSGYEIGQRVRHKALDQVGTVLSFDMANAKATLLTGKVRLSASIQDLEPISEGEEPLEEESARHIPYPSSGAQPREINLIGYRVAEALPLIDKMIDRAMVEGELSLRIVHGYGTGKLKQAIREHLKGFSCVKRISGADSQSGGEAITVVDLS
ncbi:MAG: Smr/MutS family protein [Deltaproteobacteria bacterium]|nr:MAG: Smr/MutS family protein [Deltaproteobacteria bacterium]